LGSQGRLKLYRQSSAALSADHLLPVLFLHSPSAKEGIDFCGQGQSLSSRPTQLADTAPSPRTLLSHIFIFSVLYYKYIVIVFHKLPVGNVEETTFRPATLATYKFQIG
jgi:hypothetical protein